MLWFVIVVAQSGWLATPLNVFPYVLLHRTAPPGYGLLNPHLTLAGCERERQLLIADWKTAGLNIVAECRGYSAMD